MNCRNLTLCSAYANYNQQFSKKELDMRTIVIAILLLLVTSSVFAQCGPNPVQMGMPQQATQNYNQQRAQQQQIDTIRAQADLQQQMLRLQTDFRIQQMQNAGNPQALQQAAQQYNQQVQAVQRQFQDRMRQIQGMR